VAFRGGLFLSEITKKLKTRAEYITGPLDERKVSKMKEGMEDRKRVSNIMGLARRALTETASPTLR
jgi:hypothetical protein